MGVRDTVETGHEAVSHIFWKLRCKVFPNQESTISKTVDVDTLDNDDPKAASPRKDPVFGSEAIVKTLYEGHNSSGSNYNWVDYPPRPISKSAARAQDRVAIKAYKIKDRQKPRIGGRYPLRYHSVDIQNRSLVAALEPIVKKENVLLDVNETAKFTYPFRPLWFCQDEILNMYKKMDTSNPVKDHLNLQVRVMDDMFSELRVRQRRLKASGLIDFNHAWILFPSGSTVYSYGLNSEFLAKVNSTYYVTRKEGEFLIVQTKALTFNGKEFVWTDRMLAIKEFNGNKPVRELEHYPLEFHPEGTAIKARCIARGKKMLDFQGLRYCCYDSIALHCSDGEGSKHNVEGRVLIDAVGYNKYHLHRGSRENNDPDTTRNRAGNRGRPAREDGEDGEDEAILATRKHRQSDEEQLANKKDMLSREDELAFMSELVGGYALKNKIWGMFALPYICMDTI